MPRSPLAADPLTTPLPSCKDWQPSRADACAPLPPGYPPRDVESSPLHQAIRLHRAAFVDEVHRGGHVLPAVVTRELDGVLACGVLAHGSPFATRDDRRRAAEGAGTPSATPSPAPRTSPTPPTRPARSTPRLAAGLVKARVRCAAGAAGAPLALLALCLQRRQRPRGGRAVAVAPPSL